MILALKRAFHMTILVVTHELASAFRVADRLAMLYKGSLIAVDSKDSFQKSTQPRIRQFLTVFPSHCGRHGRARPVSRIGGDGRRAKMKTEAKSASSF